MAFTLRAATGAHLTRLAKGRAIKHPSNNPPALGSALGSARHSLSITIGLFTFCPQSVDSLVGVWLDASHNAAGKPHQRGDKP